MFQGDYIARLIELGEADGHARASEIAEFIKGTRMVAGVER